MKKMARFRDWKPDTNAAADHQPPATAPGGGDVNPTALDDGITSPPVDNLAKLDESIQWVIKKRRRRRKARSYPTPLQLQTVNERGGGALEFLYRKRLQRSDSWFSVSKRLSLTRAERVMKFLTETEAAAVENGDGDGLKIVGVDGGGNVYQNLVMKKFKSMAIAVLKSDWKKLVRLNAAEKNDEVEIWGYRENDKPCFAIKFKREKNGRKIVLQPQLQLQQF